MSWDTDIALLAGQEVSVELKDSLDFPATTDITHNFVSMSVISVVLVVGSLALRPGYIAVRQLCTMICTHVWAVLKDACWFRFRFRFSFCEFV